MNAMQSTNTCHASAPQPLVILVHGTFAPNAPWTWSDSPLQTSLRHGLDDPLIQAVQWTGRNTFLDRIEAGMKILEALESTSPDVPVAVISHSHGGSAVSYAMKCRPEAFRSVRAIVCLATPFFGFSVRPGYQSLLLGIIAAVSFLVFQFALATSTIVGQSLSPRFNDQPFNVAAIGLLLLVTAMALARSLWKRRSRFYKSFETTVAMAEEWDTTQVLLKNALFARSMGDEVGLGLGTLQFVSTVLNKLLNVIALFVSITLERLDRWGRGPLGKVRVTAVLFPLLIVSALPAAMAASFGYHPRYWIDILDPWSSTFSFFDPEFGAADHSARLIYALVIIVVGTLYALVCVFAVLTLIATFLSWITTGAFGCLSLRLAIATQWAVEPTPEGQHAFLNAGWSRDVSALVNDRVGLQHSEPYAAPAVVASVVEFVVHRLRGTPTSGLPHGS